MKEDRERPPRRLPTEEDDIKPDITDEPGDLISPAEAIRRELDTYGEDSAFPNREDIEDEHGG